MNAEFTASESFVKENQNQKIKKNHYLD